MGDRQLRRAFWLGHVGTWRSSGLTRTAYCVRHDLKLATFAYWVGREKKAEALPAWVPVAVAEAAQGGTLVLCSPGGWRLEVPMGASPDWGASLLARLP